MKPLVIILIAALVTYLFLTKRSEPESPASKSPPEPVDDELLAKWKAAVDQNVLPTIKLHLTGRPASSPVASKAGGLPYWSGDREYPTGTDGAPVYFLAQINFADIDTPPPGFPTSGLLQFFIGADDLYGATFTKPDEGNRPGNYAIVFHAQPDADAYVPAPVPALAEDAYLPFEGETGIEFEASGSRPSPLDYRFDALLPGVSERYDESEPLYDYAIEPPSHQIGGYAVFTQSDPRVGSDAEDWQLLFQLDTQAVGDFEIMWGDVGIANFFIRPGDLERRDFDRVWYNWDCS